MVRIRILGLLFCAVLLALAVSGDAPALTAGLFPAPGSPFFTGGIHPVSIAAGDFNNDSAPDMAVVNTTSGDVSMLLGNGLGTLAPAAGSPFSTVAPLNPVSGAVGDVNGDGLPDVVVANDAGTVSVLLGDGHGGLSPAPGSPVSAGGIHPASVGLADFNRDGRLDVAVANNSSGDVSVLLGVGTGRFVRAPGSPYSTGGYRPVALAVGDFNRDGHPDVAVANSSSGDESVLLGDGQGRLSPAPGSPFAIGGFRPWSTTVGDFNNDGKLDVATVNHSSGDVSVLLGDGRGGLRPASGSPFATGGYHPVSIAAGNLNADRKLDVAIANNSGDVSVLLGDGAGGLNPADGSPFADSGFHPSAVTLADLNRDGRLDVAVANNSGDVAVLLNSGQLSSSSCTLIGRSAKVRSGSVAFRVTCPYKAAGTLTLNAAGTAAGQGRLGPALGKRRFSVRSGRPVKVSVRLTRKGKGMLRRRKRLRIQATVLAHGTGADGRATLMKTTRTVTIKK